MSQKDFIEGKSSDLFLILVTLNLIVTFMV